ncbi:MAG: hypothetical protein U1B83_08025, partial [Candidatus Cloacimonadaceae bacterium]|nr:hypothetical protein [Candidatus Cloacimonadaceae bacterium]
MQNPVALLPGFFIRLSHLKHLTFHVSRLTKKDATASACTFARRSFTCSPVHPLTRSPAHLFT